MEVTPTIILNGSSRPIPGPLALDRLLDLVGLAGRPVVVEVNTRAIFPRDYPATIVQPGANVEIVTLAAGG